MELTIDQFIHTNNIKPADSIRMKKKFLGMLEHYVIYLGIHNRQHKFIANYSKGVSVIPDDDLSTLVQILEPSAIEPFPGNERQRQYAINRAFSRIGEKSYDIILNNCEHFKNWVHYGEDSSKQVEKFGSLIAVGGISVAIAGLSKKDPVLTCVGILAALLGAYVYQTETKTETNNRVSTYTLQ